jgi:hypothetical protein
MKGLEPDAAPPFHFTYIQVVGRLPTAVEAKAVAEVVALAKFPVIQRFHCLRSGILVRFVRGSAEHHHWVGLPENKLCC